MYTFKHNNYRISTFNKKFLVVLAITLSSSVLGLPTGENTSEVVVKVDTKQEVVHELSFPVLRCEDIIPDQGEPGKDNHQACHAHCTTLHESYQGGRCVKDICLCQTRKAPEGNTPPEHPTVKCEHIVPRGYEPSKDNHRACESHCRGLGQHYTRGECKKEVCHCRRQEQKLKHTSQNGSKSRVQRHPTVKCEYLRSEEEEGTRPGKEHLCSGHCRTLGEEYGRGLCTEGVCYCEGEEQRERKSVPTVRCEDIVPDNGESGAENHIACRAHCLGMGEVYSAGKCVEGVCRCEVKKDTAAAGKSGPKDHVQRRSREE